MKFKVGDKVVRVNENGRNFGGYGGDDFDAKVGMVATISNNGLNWNYTDGRVGVTYAGINIEMKVWFAKNFVAEAVYNSPLYSELR